MRRPFATVCADSSLKNGPPRSGHRKAATSIIGGSASCSVRGATLLMQIRQVSFIAALCCVAILWPRPAGAQRVLSEGIKELSADIATSVSTEQKRRVAVVPFRELG